MKYKYSVDDNNQLMIKPPEKGRPVVASGKFSIGQYNRLIYWLNEPAPWRREYGLAPKIVFKGKWQLNSDYDLELILKEAKDQCKGDRLAIKGEIISTDSDTLVFEIKSIDKQGLSHMQLLKLSGIWQADEYNRLSFAVEKKASPDMLTLEGIWQINQNQQIIYVYEKTNLKRKTKTSHILIFEGFWQINRSHRLTYILERSSGSRFDFRVQIESPNLYPKKGVVKYRLGIGLRGKKAPGDRVICLYGTWKFSRKLGLVFQMDYGQGQVQSLEFGTELSLTQRDKVTFALKNETGERLGINITFTHKFLKQNEAEVFLRLKEILQRESAIETGIRIPF